ncbi:response regulator [Desulfovibrio psychrotolerans]|uniref:Sensory/regulatory protein RpfC n=1 Tax=Desulfovibrio psychrotolerans TaxID=415242 RepID=A0A7J0BQG8_9BACT|nr:response regulator [Desulfovibrio psychrotolerans]GFM35919.1 hypothetical protein DSM19430T_06030 [Desulfovibrio psychrotolerans]
MKSEIEQARERIAQLEAQLKAQTLDAEADMRAVLDATGQSILLIRADGIVLHANKTAARNYDRSPSDLIGRNILEVLPAPVARHRRAILDRCITQKAPLAFTDTRNGRTFAHNVYPILDGDHVRRFAVYSEDITDILHKDREVAASRHQQSVLLEILSLSHTTESLDALLASIHGILRREVQAENLYVVLMNPHDGSPDYRYCVDSAWQGNAAARPPCGWKDNLLCLEPLRRNGAVQFSGTELCALNESGALSTPAPVPLAWLGIPLRVQGKAIGVLATQEYTESRVYTEDEVCLLTACSDQIAIAIERKRAEELMQESAEHYRAFFEDNHSVMLLLDSASGDILDLNKAAEAYYGYPRQRLAGKSIAFLNLFPEAKLREVLSKLSEQRITNIITRHRLANGEMRDVEVYSGPFTVNGRRRLISIVHDITRRLKDEAALSAAKEAAELASRVKGEFVANISHEVRTPLNGLMGMLQLLLETPLSEEQFSYIHTALQSSKNLLRVLNDVLDFTKMEAGKLSLLESTFRVSDILDHTASLFAQQARAKGLTLQVRSDGLPGDLYAGDDGRIRQVLFNLVGNAIKFTDSGQITVETWAMPDRQPECRRLFFSVADTGIGISPARIHHIFEPFTQVDGSLSRRYQGSGLGLTIVKRLVELMGGGLLVDSEPGQGTSITFHVLVREPAKSICLLTATEDSASGLLQPLRILLVEDEQVNMIMAQRILEKMGHMVTCARNGKAGLEKLHEQRFDVVLMDIQMPVMDGLEATRRIRNAASPMNPQDIPVIAVTAHATSRDRDDALEAGMDGYVIKPFERDILASAIHSALLKRACIPGGESGGYC